MTDIQEQPQPAASDSASATAGSTPPSAAAASRPAAKASAAKAPASKSSPAKSSLSAKLLPELQQIAGGLGINTSKKKKADLVAAIQAARSGSAPTAAAAKGDAPTTSAPKSDAPTSLTSEAPKSDAPRTRERRIATSASGAPPSTSVDAPTADQPEPTRRERPRRERPARTDAASTDPGSSGAPAGAEAAPATDTDRQQNERSQNDRQQGDRQRSQNNGGAPNAQRNDRNGAQNNGQRNENNQRNEGQNNGQRNDNNQRNEGQNNGQRNEAPRDDDDDFDGRGRRGRRYRDRRGRNRDRQGGTVGGSGQTGNTDVEPTITEDDVLVPVGGVLDCLEDNKSNWYIRVEGYFASPDDVFVANSFVRRYNLRRGDAVTGTVRQAKDGERREKYNPLVRLDSVNGRDPESLKNRVEFTKLTPLYPQERLRLETEPHILTTRVIDLVMPIGKGQRALIVSPPKAGKTMVLQAIANAIVVNNPEAHLMVVLVDERPEEVTDMQRSVKGEVIASTFDRRPQDHIAVAELSIERAKRLVEMGHDVVVLLDSITRLGRAYNLGAPASGRILSGGVDSQALYQPKRFLGAARNIENGGSLTIIATALVETGSAGDTVFFEEYKGTGNAELKLDRKIADKRIFPAIDVDQSSTRKEELLLSPDELAVTIKLRRVLHSLEQQQAIELLLDRLRKTRTNIEFLMQIAKTTPGGES